MRMEQLVPQSMERGEQPHNFLLSSIFKFLKLIEKLRIYRFPLDNVAIFHNIKYGTFENALNYRDGLAEVYFFIDIVSFLTNFK